MRQVLIQDKLEEINQPVESLALGEFDYIGEYTAKKNRGPDSPLFKSAGCFFRPNYERGLLIHSLIKTFKIESFLEIGFGRGYGSMCASRAMTEMGIEGKITTVDPNFNEEHLTMLAKVFPKDWFHRIEFCNGTSDMFFEKSEEKYGLIYIDGDHRQEAVQKDWEGASQAYSKFILFDDYYLPTKKEKDIEVSSVVDKIEADKELIIMDRRIFVDDRKLSDSEIDYGQVLIKNPEFDTSQFLLDW